MKRLALGIMTLAIMVAVGCGPDPSTPEGVYRQFLKAMLSKTYDEMYPTLSNATQQTLTDIAENLKKLDGIPGAPRKLTSGEDRLGLTKAAHEGNPGKAIIAMYFSDNPVSLNEEQKRGSEPKEVRVEGDKCIITTVGGEEVLLKLEADDKGTKTWRITALEYIMLNLKNEVDTALASNVKPIETPDTAPESATAFINSLKSGSYDGIYGFLDLKTRAELDEIARMSGKIFAAFDKDRKNEKLKVFLADKNHLRLARTGKDVLVSSLNRFSKPGSIDGTGATIISPITDGSANDITLAPTLPGETPGEILFTTAAGETLRFFKEMDKDKEVWHTDFLLPSVTKTADAFRKFVTENKLDG